ncbi:domain of Kin17 curved DNA-binding protein-domain-containing protein [Xylariaceae sp. FL0662B]|nr:domain of Kin17 curved DNA-binding protein-domain-containing protein [Xylariaceae sp. FL0662B]
MPRAEAGSTKHLSNQMKSKGLQRLRWYCQPCQRQLRDENAFKMHTQSEGHVRTMLLVGEDPKKYINDYSNQFLKDFIQLLRTSHGEKSVHINHFYQNYISNKEHIHMNATKWPSLTEFAKYLGREGICRVEETDKGLHIAWIDDSPDALRRRDALRRKEMQDKGDEEREQKMIREQIRRARREAGQPDEDDAGNAEDRELKRQEGEKIKLSFGAKPAAQSAPSASTEQLKSETTNSPKSPKDGQAAEADAITVQEKSTPADKPATAPISMKMAAKPQTKNVFAAAKKNALAGSSKKASAFEQPKKMSEAERIMKEELERKRSRENSGFGGGSNKRQRT